MSYVWITVGQGPSALVVGAGGGCLDIFTLIYPFLSSFSLSLGDGPIWTEILSQRAVKPKTTNQLYPGTIWFWFVGFVGLVWTRVGQGPTALAVGAGVGCWLIWV